MSALLSRVEVDLGRRKQPLPCPLPFSYWVFGRPVSTQNDDGRKPRALPAWRDKVKSALGAIVFDSTRERGYEILKDRVEIRIVWLSTDPFDLTQPDVDNILKPLIDALVGTIIEDDRQVHRILAEKANVNAPPAALDDVYPDIQNDADYSGGELIVVRLDRFNLDYRP